MYKYINLDNYLEGPISKSTDGHFIIKLKEKCNMTKKKTNHQNVNDFKVKIHDVYSNNFENVFIENLVNYNLNINTQYNRLITKILKCHKVNKNDFFLFYLTYNKSILNNTIQSNNLTNYINNNKLYITLLPINNTITLNQYLSTTLLIIESNKHNYDTHLSNVNSSFSGVMTKIKKLHKRNFIIFNVSSDCIYISNLDYNQNNIFFIYNYYEKCSFIPFNIHKKLDKILLNNMDSYLLTYLNLEKVKKIKRNKKILLSVLKNIDFINFLEVYINIYNQTGEKYNSKNNRKLTSKLTKLSNLKQNYLNEINLLLK